MPWHRRSFPHQNLIARQGNPNTSLIQGGGFQPTTSSGQNSTPTVSNTPPAGGKNGGKDSTSASSPATSPTGQPQSSNSATSSQTGSSTTPTGSASSSSTQTSASSTNTNTQSSTFNVNTTPTPTYVVSTPKAVGPSTSIFTYTGIAGSSTAPPASTGTSSGNNSNTVGGMSTGALVGVIAGGLFGLICLIALSSYILRWWNKRSAERDFVDDYNTPDVMGNSSAHDFPPPMTQHASSPSLSSGAGIAGQGISASRAPPAMTGPGAYRGGYGGYPAADDESINGPFSSQPQAQSAYNAESYGQYASYNHDAGYQEAMRGYQGQRGYEAPVNVGYAVSGPSTPQPAIPASLTPRSTTTTTAAAAIAAAHAAAATPVSAAPASAEYRQSAAYNEEDAYGGF